MSEAAGPPYTTGFDGFMKGGFLKARFGAFVLSKTEKQGIGKVIYLGLENHFEQVHGCLLEVQVQKASISQTRRRRKAC